MSNSVLDIDAILADLPGDLPAGPDLRLETGNASEYALLKDEMAYAREKPEKWPAIHDRAAKMLVKRSKDLEVAAWLTEAAAAIHGFAGLADGLRAARGLLESFWDRGLWPEAVKPRLDREGVLAKLLGDGIKLGQLRADRLPLTKPHAWQSPGKKTFQKAFSVRDFDLAEQVQAASDVSRGGAESARAQRLESGAPSPEAVEAALLATPASDLVRTAELVRDAKDHAERIQRFVSEKMDQATLPEGYERKRLDTSLFIGSLDKVVEVLGRIPALGEVEPEAPLVSNQSETSTRTVPEDAPAPAVRTRVRSAPGAPADRAAATEQIKDLARFFRETYPESPVGFALERIARWAAMDWPTLQGELLGADDGFRDAKRRLEVIVGIPPK